MPEKEPTISEVIDTACVNVKAVRGYDVNAAEGRAFCRQFWFQVLRMPKEKAVRFIARCLKHYEKERKRSGKK